MKKFRTYKNSTWGHGPKGRIRIVNQDEIRSFLMENPGRTENDIMYQLYDYERGSTLESNKKYAECLRRALQAGKISRARAQFPDRKRFIYFAI